MPSGAPSVSPLGAAGGRHMCRPRDRCMHRSPAPACGGRTDCQHCAGQAVHAPGRTIDCRGMDFGVGYFPTHQGFTPGEIARFVEERGQSALFFAEHTHIPASRASPFPSGGELPSKYWHTYDLFVALTAAAAATTLLRVGSGICLIIERDPITTAKEVASIDHLSGGRMEFGVGAGWNREEM